jgi:hypothetical protein
VQKIGGGTPAKGGRGRALYIEQVARRLGGSHRFQDAWLTPQHWIPVYALSNPRRKHSFRRKYIAKWNLATSGKIRSARSALTLFLLIVIIIIILPDWNRCTVGGFPVGEAPVPPPARFRPPAGMKMRMMM